MQIRPTIKTNDELYGDLELIPLNTDAVDQRVQFFKNKYQAEYNKNRYSANALKYYKAWKHWEDMKIKHCMPEEKSDRFEKEYLRGHWEQVSSHKEEIEWTKLEKKIGAITINCKDVVTPKMREWFNSRFGFKADDCSVLKRWEEDND